MSTKVQLRREAASFLASYVGAPGEMLVDTTNNRALVQDGATPGGFAAAKLSDLQGRNLIINGNFAINQRGYVSGGALASGAYAHDRWKDSGSGNLKYTFTQGTPDTLIAISAGTIQQFIEPQNVGGGSYIASWVGTVGGQLYTSDGSVFGTLGPSPQTITGVSAGKTLVFQSVGNGTLKNVQVEAGTVATLFERRQIAVEMALCQRYLEYISSLIFSMYSSASGIVYYYSIPMKVTKRASPTVTLTNLAVNGFTTTPGLNAVSADQVVAALKTTQGGDGLFAQFSAKMEAEL